MTAVESKGSKQYRSVVVPHRPGRKLISIAVSLAAVVTVAIFSAWYGARTMESSYRLLNKEYEQVSQQLAAISLKLTETEQQLVNVSVGAEIDRVAMEEARKINLQQKKDITGLKEEISFYKGLMAPSDREKGLSIRAWTVHPTNDPDRFQFKVIVQQLALKHLLMAGYVNVVILGSKINSDDSSESVSQSYSLDVLSEQVAEEKIKLRFKYFQTIEGELKLPEGFKPERVHLVAQVSKPKYVQIEKNYSWSVQGI